MFCSNASLWPATPSHSPAGAMPKALNMPTPMSPHCWVTSLWAMEHEEQTGGEREDRAHDLVSHWTQNCMMHFPNTKALLAHVATTNALLDKHASLDKYASLVQHGCFVTGAPYA